MDNKEIEYYTREVWGVRRHYIKDVETAKAVTMLTNRATLDMKDFIALETLGFTFKQVLPPNLNSL